MWLKNYWWILVIVLAISLAIRWEEERCQTQAYQCRAQYTAQLESVVPNEEASEDQAIAAACEPNGYLCRLFGATSLPSVILIFVGIAGIWAAIRTLKTVERQTQHVARQALSMRRQTTLLRESAEAAKTSAEAAKTTAEALVAAERAWVDGRLVSSVLAGAVRFQLKAINRGKTPARLISYDIRYSCCVQEHYTDDLKELGGSFVSLDSLLGPSEERAIGELLPLNQFFRDCKRWGLCEITIAYADLVSRNPNHFTRFKMLYDNLTGDTETLTDKDSYT